MIIAKLNTGGTQDWVKEYPNLIYYDETNSAKFSSDETTIRLLGKASGDTGQFAEIATNDGTVNGARTIDNFHFSSTSFQNSLECSPTASSSVCFAILRNQSNTDDYKACKIDFSSTGTIGYSKSNDSDYAIDSIAPLDNDNIIIGGYKSVIPNKIYFYSANFSSNSVNWAIQADTLSK